MARLNDVPAPTDPVELVRRKYYRQNKEIARVNSVQGVRIRNLENEVSRLLSENLSLQGQVIHLQSELESSQPQRVVEHVSKIRAQLDTKLQELEALVTQLGEDPTPPQKRSARERKSRSSLTRSPGHKNWKTACTLSEAIEAQEGRLPTIVETKSYPRLTLERDEIAALNSEIIDDNTDSPDIGPPPVSHLIDEDPVKIDLPKMESAEINENIGLDPALSINLEQRRKRKDLTGSTELKRPSRFEPQAGREIAQSLKTSAKRKLSVRDDDGPGDSASTMENSPDNFQFTRKAIEDKAESRSAPVAVAPKSGIREVAIARTRPREKVTSIAPSLVSGTRKVLGPKTTNHDVVSSPKKSGKAARKDEGKGSPIRVSSRDHLHERKHISELRANKLPDIASIHISPEPETPAAALLDIFSPPSAGPSVPRIESRDTPPPPDLDSGMDSQRPRRRARESVSYAEPNLRDKMRRPTGDMADAVTGESKMHRSSLVVKPDTEASAIVIKDEPGSEDAWRNIPRATSVSVYATSPLSDKMVNPEVHENLLPQRRRRASGMHYNTEADFLVSGSGAAVMASLTGSKKIKQETKDEEAKQSQNTLEKDMAKLDIYEYSTSSPKEPCNSKIPHSKEDRHAPRVSKRTYALPHEGVTTSNGVNTEIPSKASSTSSRRRQMKPDLGQTATMTEDVNQKAAGLSLKRSNSVAGQVELFENNSRSERVAQRRRSMML